MDSVTMGWTVIGVGIALAGLMLATTRSIRADMRVLLERQDKLAERLGRQEQEQTRMNGVLETLPERLGRLEQEQARMNGMLETIRAGLSYRVERADTGDRVAEASESYEPQE